MSFLKILFKIFLLILIIVSIYLIYPKPVYNKELDFTYWDEEIKDRDRKKGIWIHNMCTSGRDKNFEGPWCYQKCYDSSNYKFYACKIVTKRFRVYVDGYGDIIIACPVIKNANYLDEFCSPLSIS